MALRSKGPHNIIDEFSGVDDIVDEVKIPKDFVSWASGVYPTEQKRMQRIPGKLTNATSTSLGRILSLTQLSFEDSDCVVIHTSTILEVETDMSLLVSSSSGVSPLEGFIS